MSPHSARLSLILLATGSGGLPPTTAELLAASLERAGVQAALAAGGPALRGASPPAAGRLLALARVELGGAPPLRVLHPPTPSPLDLRSWCLGCRAAGVGPRAPLAAPPESNPVVATLSALLAPDSPCREWLAAYPGALCTLLVPPPTGPVPAEALAELLRAAAVALVGVCVTCVATEAADVSDDAVALRLALQASETGSYDTVKANAAAADALALRLVFPERSAAARPAVTATLRLPQPLLACRPGSSVLRLVLRPAIAPLHDCVRAARVCRCHGRGLLSRDTALSESDISDLLCLAEKNSVCPVSAAALGPHEWLPNCVLLGRDAVLQLPSFYTPPFQLASPLDAHSTDDPAPFDVLARLPLDSVSAASLFGLPWLATPAPAEEAEGDTGNAALMAALVATLSDGDCGLLLASPLALDAGRRSPFRALYLALPSDAPSSATLLLKRLAGREEVTPQPVAQSVKLPPAAVMAEVAAVIKGLPQESGSGVLGWERGVWGTVAGLVSTSIALPPRTGPRPAEGGKGKRKGLAGTARPFA